MIPESHITAWNSTAPWRTTQQIEQDLVVSRAMVSIYSDPLLAQELIMRGGTAIHKLLFKRPLRYSEDIDLVRQTKGPIGRVMNGLKAALEWLGKPKTSRTKDRITLVFRFPSQIPPVAPLRLKVEINTEEAQNSMPLRSLPYRVENPWFSERAPIATYQAEELFGTKLRGINGVRHQRGQVRIREMPSEGRFPAGLNPKYGRSSGFRK